jgi:hypothetical protein
MLRNPTTGNVRATFETFRKTPAKIRVSIHLYLRGADRSRRCSAIFPMEDSCMKLTRRDALKLGLVGTGALFSPAIQPKPALAASSNCPPAQVCCPNNICMVGAFDELPLSDRPSPTLIQPFEQALPIP